MATEWKDYYEILRIARNATKEEIITAYERLRKLYRATETSNGNEYMSKLITEACEVLSKSLSRATYNTEWDRRKGRINTQASLPSGQSAQPALSSGKAELAKNGDRSVAPSTPKFVDHYNTLNLDRRIATIKDVKEAYNRVYDAYQAGAFGANGDQILAFAKTAIAVLGNPDSKRHYDAQWDKINLPKVKTEPQEPKKQEPIRPKPQPQPTVHKATGQPKTEPVSRPIIKKSEPAQIVVQRQEVKDVRLTEPLTEEFSRPTKEFGMYTSTGRPRKVLLAAINAAFLQREQLGIEKRPTSDSIFNVNGMYGLFLEDYTFQFVFENDHLGGFFGVTQLYSLYTCLGENCLMKDYEFDRRPWRNFGQVFEINGQRAIIVPADRLIPADLMKYDYHRSWGYANTIRKDNLVYVRDVITSIVLSKPELLDAYFDDPTVDDGSKTIHM